MVALLFVAAQTLFGLGLPRAQAQPLQQAPDRLRLDIDKISPRMVRADTTTLTVTGSITNIGDRRITDLVARVELGSRLTTDSEARAALQGPLPHYRSASRFTDLARALQPGQSTDLRLTVPLDGSPGGLNVTQPGVYPLLINVNGTPDFGGPARLVAADLLLPVLAVPGSADRGGSGTSGGPGGSGTTDPLSLTVLWPITTRHPVVLRDVYGKPLVLADDSIARSLAPGGRLYGLVSAAAGAVERGQLGSGMCFALDPALLSTVQRMAGGYQVRTNSGTVAGKGAENAKQWLEALRQLVEGRCVVQLPYADADLSSLARIGSTGEGGAGLTALAVDGADVIKQLLGVRPLPGVLWPADGVSDAALDAAADAGVSKLITSSARLPASVSASAGTSGVRLASTSIRAQTFDPLLHRALRHDPSTADVAVQNGLGALVLRIRQQQSGTAPVLLAPPHHWGAPPGELATFLRAIGDFAAAGKVDPTPLQQSLRAEPTASAPTDPSISEATNEVAGSFLATLSEVDATATKLVSAMSVDATSLVQPETLVRPLREGVLRAVSAAWQGAGPLRGSAVRAAQEQVEAITSQVTVTPPNQPIALASSDSPLPVYISNNLPVTITVRISLLSAGGLAPEQIPYQTIPANSSRNRNINIEPLRAGHITAQVKLSTPEGVQLGELTRFELVSTAYGTITIVVTATAAAALLLLSGRRIYRRVRARK